MYRGRGDRPHGPGDEARRRSSKPVLQCQVEDRCSATRGGCPGRLGLAGCGSAPAVPTGVQLTVTREFGAHVLHPGQRSEGGGEETVMSLLMRNCQGHHPLWRRVRAEHRRHSAGSRRRQPARLVLLRQRRRGAKGRGRDDVHPGDHIWWDLPRLEPDRGRPRRRRLVPGAVPERHRRQAPARADRMRRGDRARLPARSSPGCARSACPPAARRSARGEEPDTLRVLVGPWTHGRATTERPACIEAGAALQRRLRAASRRRLEHLTLLDPDGRRSARSPPGPG